MTEPKSATSTFTAADVEAILQRVLTPFQSMLNTAMQQQSSSTTNAVPAAPKSNTAELFSSIASQIENFNYDAESDCTFEKWYNRFEGFINEAGSDLSDTMKVKLILNKLGRSEYESFTESILPTDPTTLQLQDFINKLKNKFESKKSLFLRRFECFRLRSHGDDIDFAAKVNAQCEAAKIDKLSAEQIKMMIYVAGLSDDNNEFRLRCISLMEKNRKEIEATPAGRTPPAALTLSDIVEECRALQSLKFDARAANINSPSATNAITSRPQHLKDHNNKRRNTFHNRRSSSPAPTNRFERRGKPPSPCWRCSEWHWSENCRMSPNVICSKCQQKGHSSAACHLNNKMRTRRHSSSQRGNNRQRNHSSNATDVEQLQSMAVLSVISNDNQWIWADLNINHKPVKLAVDTCSRITIIQKQLWAKLGKPKLTPVSMVGKTYSGQSFQIAGSFKCQVEFRGITLQLDCYVAAGPVLLNLMGLPWIRSFETQLQQPIATTLTSTVNAVQQSQSITAESIINKLKTSFPQVFDKSLGHCNKMRAHLHLKPDVEPVFCRARPVPVGAQAAIDAELDRLQSMQVIKPIDYCRWAAPILAVKKKNGDIRVCIDFSTGLNDALELNRHPLPLTADIFNKLNGAKYFSQIDLKDAYLQIELDDESKHLVAINTHRGLFQFQRLPFGVKSAPAIFQKLMDQLTAGLERVFCYLDDLIIASSSLQEHFQQLFQLFSRLNNYGLHIKPEKCHFLQHEIQFLGHIVNADGIKPDPQRSAALRNMPAPTNIQELRSFLGAINYYAKFINKMRAIRSPLDELLKKDTPFHWGPEQQQAFDHAKAILQSDMLLTHYDPSKPIIVSADASNNGIGATISHRFPDGSEKVIEHAARTLTTAERQYSQIEKEALSLIFAVQKFHRMLYGRQFILQTDHKPLISIFGSKKGIPIYTAARLQRWALILANYDFKIQHVRTDQTGQADMLSRLIANNKTNEDHVIALGDINEQEIQFIFSTNIEPFPVTAQEIADHTTEDTLVQQVLNHMQHGWPKHVQNGPLAAFHHRADELSTVEGCLLLGQRVFIPLQLRQRILKSLHTAHPGMVRMKSVARQHVFWPGMDKEIEQFVRHCTECQMTAKAPLKAVLHPWPATRQVFERIHADFAGPCADGHHYLILVDAFSKWPEIVKMTSITAASVQAALDMIFSRMGLPQQLVTDNGPPFSSSDFATFCKQREIKHLFSPPYHPQSNGQAERVVDIFKRQYAKMGKTNKNWMHTFLFNYRTTPHTALNGMSPAELVFGRKLRTQMDLVHPNMEKHSPLQFTKQQQNMANQFNKHHNARLRTFTAGDQVFFRTWKGNKNIWEKGTITDGNGVIWIIKRSNSDSTARRHTNHIRLISTAVPTDILVETERAIPQFQPQKRKVSFDERQNVIIQHNAKHPLVQIPNQNNDQISADEHARNHEQHSIVNARPQRHRKPPKRLVMDSTKSRYAEESRRY